jgi:hypothetical protein
MKKLALTLLIVSILLPFAIWAQCSSCASKSTCASGEIGNSGTPAAKMLAGYNKVNWINENYSFTYAFDKKPKLGNAILKVKVLNKAKKITGDYEVFATADMPSMKGMHASGDIKMKANKKGELLVPLNFVMPGVWQVDLKFVKGGKQAFAGSFQLKI